jgi:hypothetical protein
VTPLCKTDGLEERRPAIAAIGRAEVGLRADPKRPPSCVRAASWRLRDVGVRRTDTAGRRWQRSTGNLVAGLEGCINRLRFRAGELP